MITRKNLVARKIKLMLRLPQIKQMMINHLQYQETFLQNKRKDIRMIIERNLQIIQTKNQIKQLQLVRHKKWLRKGNRNRGKTYLIMQKQLMECREVMLPRKQKIAIRIKIKQMVNGQRTLLNSNQRVKINLTSKTYLEWEEIKLLANWFKELKIRNEIDLYQIHQRKSKKHNMSTG